jgi:hypothetical protein
MKIDRLNIIFGLIAITIIILLGFNIDETITKIILKI